MIDLRLKGVILGRMGDRKAVVVKGARQVGKTTLLKSLFGKVAKIQSAGASNAIEDID